MLLLRLQPRGKALGLRYPLDLHRDQAFTAAWIRSNLPLIVDSSRGGTGRGSSQRVISRTTGKPRTMITIPGTTQENTS